MLVKYKFPIKNMNLLTVIILTITVAIFSNSQAAEDEKYPVAITNDLPYIDIEYKKNKIRIKRIQNENNRLTDNYTKTSRPCPPFCITPLQVADNVKTVGELEVINFVKNKVADGSGLLIDARLAEFHDVETLPGAINIPFTLFSGPKITEVVDLLGAEKKQDNYNFDQAKTIYFFCNGPWCSQSPRAIKALLTFGYPADKIYYYRGGMQLWKLFSLTTVIPKPNKIEE